MNINKIGFLDSGIGGLTVLEAFCTEKNAIQASPHSEIIYLADVKNLPYGEKSLEDLSKILKTNLRWFSEQKTNIVVLACNTSSALLTPEIKQQFINLEIFDLINALAQKIKKEYFDLKHIAIFSTLATHRSQAYRNTLQKALPKAQIVSIPCPAFVPLIEEQLLENNFDLNKTNELALTFLEEYVKALPFEPEAIILGCTHYPILRLTFEQTFKNSLLLNPAQALVEQLQKKHKFNSNNYFQAFSTAQEDIFEAKLKALTKVLNCVQHFSNSTQIARTF